MTHLQGMHYCSINYVKAPIAHLQDMHCGSINYVWLLWFYYKIILLVLYALIYNLDMHLYKYKFKTDPIICKLKFYFLREGINFSKSLLHVSIDIFLRTRLCLHSMQKFK